MKATGRDHFAVRTGISGTMAKFKEINNFGGTRCCSSAILNKLKYEIAEPLAVI